MSTHRLEPPEETKSGNAVTSRCTCGVWAGQSSTVEGLLNMFEEHETQAWFHDAMYDLALDSTNVMAEMEREFPELFPPSREVGQQAAEILRRLGEDGPS